ncbi:MAG: glycosyltransferase family 39 protein [Caldilineaceae bacterium]|nr:glycosyltransferase family 39 protein [Caldilineaceae bacterium]
MNVNRADRQRLALLALILLAFALRVYRLDAQSLWYDEGVTAMLGRLSPAEMVRWTAADIQPPLYYFLTAIWGRLAGWSEWSLRFVSVWWGVALVPLMTILTMHLTRRLNAGLVAGLITAIHPLLVYYSQEARMYALLTALGVIAGYCVVRLGEGRQRPALYLAYIGAAVAALYTHYFALFLLAALAIAYRLDQPSRPTKRAQSPISSLPISQSPIPKSPPSNLQSSIFNLQSPFILANLAILLLFLPWLIVMLTQLNQDASYWQGALKLGEALRKVAVSFIGGETVTERQGLWLLPLYGAITLVTGWRLWRMRSEHRTLRYGLLWLLIPTAAVLLLATFVPKFNARYVMLALPGLILLWAAGGTKIEDQKTKIEDKKLKIGDLEPAAGAESSIFNLQSLLRWGSLLVITICSLFALTNWFANPAFTKDDWRGVTEFLRPRLGEEEAIALISGHAWPVWDYYAPDLPALRLPDLRILDVNAVLDFSDTAAPLQATLDPLSERPGIWLIGWQEDVVDPTGVVPTQLTIAGKEKGLDTHYWGITLRRFSQLKTPWIPAAPPIDHALDAQFGNDLVLRGVSAIDNGDLLLFWQRVPGRNLTASAFVIGGQALDASGAVIAELPNLPPAGYHYPVHHWPDDRIAMGVIPAIQWLGPTPTPGTYSVTLRLYADQDGQRTLLTTRTGGESVTVAEIEVVIE